MPELRDLYQEVIIDHSRRPRNFGLRAEADRQAEGFNPLCGDRIVLQLKVRDGRIEDARFDGAGCAISTASASLMTEALKGKTEAEAMALFEAFHAFVMGEADVEHCERVPLDKLEVLGGVTAFPARVKCATLAWHTLQAALAGARETISTE